MQSIIKILSFILLFSFVSKASTCDAVYKCSEIAKKQGNKFIPMSLTCSPPQHAGLKYQRS